MKEILEFLKDAQTYYLGTIDKDGNPSIRPFGTINLYNDKLYIQTGKVKNVYKEIIANPNINICAMNNKGQWIRINAIAIEDNDIAASEDMLKNYPSLQGMYKVGDGNNTVFYLKNGKAIINSFGSEPKTIEF